MNENWQTFAAIAVVLTTLAIFIVRAVRRSKKSGCGGGCGCSPRTGR